MPLCDIFRFLSKASYAEMIFRMSFRSSMEGSEIPLSCQFINLTFIFQKSDQEFESLLARSL